MRRNINVAIVDDHNLVREGFRTLLKDAEGIRILFDVSDGLELIEELKKRKLKPDVLLLDLEMPGMNGFETTKYIKEHYPKIQIIIVSMYMGEEVILDLIKAGAASYLDKNTDHLELEKAIEEVFHNNQYYSEKVSLLLAKSLKKRRRRHEFNNNVEFSDIELDVIKLMCKEMKNSEIADAVCRSVGSVEAIKRSVFRKTGTKTSLGVMKFAIKNQIVDLG